MITKWKIPLLQFFFFFWDSPQALFFLNSPKYRTYKSSSFGMSWWCHWGGPSCLVYSFLYMIVSMVHRAVHILVLVWHCILLTLCFASRYLAGGRTWTEAAEWSGCFNWSRNWKGSKHCSSFWPGSILSRNRFEIAKE